MKPAGWERFDFLMGEWAGEGGGDPGQGQGQGSFSFAYDLDGRVIIRKNRTDFPASGGRPAARHEDLLIIYAWPGGHTRGIYFDNEGHVINYAVVWRSG